MVTLRFIMIAWASVLVCGAGCATKDVAEAAENGPEISVGPTAERASYTVDVAAGKIATLYVGMSESELRSSGLPYNARYEVLEGDEYLVYDVRLPDDAKLTCTLDLERTVYKIESTSPKIRDEYGLGVKSQLGELRKAYPTGRLIKGTAEGRFVHFLTGSRLIFTFNHSDLQESCFNLRRDCVIDDEMVVQSIFVTRYAPR